MDRYSRTILPASFYDRDSAVVARALLGKYIARNLNGQLLVGKIVETEAYLSADDPAAHHFNGKTDRNKSLYKSAGHAYVHRMRQWHLIDVVTEKEGTPSSVLLRAVEPVDGIEIMKTFRHTDIVQNIASGPSKFCQAFQIDMTLDGTDMTAKTSPIIIFDGGVTVSEEEISVSVRIGISKAADLPLRFWITGSPFVSR